MKEYPAKESTCQEILSEITPFSLNKVDDAIVDFLHDSIVITKGGLDSNERIITT